MLSITLTYKYPQWDVNYKGGLKLIRKIIVIGMIIQILCLSINSSIAVNNVKKTYNPISSGNTLYVGGTGEGNYTCIQDAIDNSSNGDTVFVYDESSPYIENIHISKSLQIVGENRNTTIVLSNNKSDAVNITGVDVKFIGFTLQTAEDTFNYLKLNANDIQISDNRFVNTTILSQDYDNISITNNIFKNGKWSKRIIVNLINGNSCLIKGNNVSRSNSGIRISNCRDCKICFNTVHNCFTGIADVNGNSNVINNNKVDVANYGIYLNGNKAIVENNTIFSSNFGIKLYYTYFAHISKNDIFENLFGIDMERAYLSKITSNNFKYNIGNTFVINSFLTRWNHNYWDRPRLSPKIIIVCIELFETTFESLLIPYLNFDWRPALKPYDI